MIELNKKRPTWRRAWPTPRASPAAWRNGANDRPQPAQRDAEGVQSAMKGLEQQGGQMFGQMISAGLTGKRMDFMKIGQDMATAFANKAGQMLMSHLMDVFQNVIGSAFTSAATKAGTTLTTDFAQGAASLTTAGTQTGTVLTQRRQAASRLSSRKGPIFLCRPGKASSPCFQLISGGGGGGIGAFWRCRHGSPASSTAAAWSCTTAA